MENLQKLFMLLFVATVFCLAVVGLITLSKSHKLNEERKQLLQVEELKKLTKSCFITLQTNLRCEQIWELRHDGVWIPTNTECVFTETPPPWERTPPLCLLPEGQ
jgi:hypothetical protein